MEKEIYKLINEEIDKEYLWLMNTKHMLYDIDIAFSGIKTIIKKYIEALEQEPFINKPCASKDVCEHDKQRMLDKIISEIEQKAKLNEIGGRGNGKIN